MSEEETTTEEFEVDEGYLLRPLDVDKDMDAVNTFFTACKEYPSKFDIFGESGYTEWASLGNDISQFRKSLRSDINSKCHWICVDGDRIIGMLLTEFGNFPGIKRVLFLPKNHRKKDLPTKTAEILRDWMCKKGCVELTTTVRNKGGIQLFESIRFHRTNSLFLYKCPIRLSTLTLRRFKSIGKLEGFQLGDLNVLIGPNGAGKSNFISFFRLLSQMSRRALREYVARSGGASALLHDGPSTSPQFEACLTFTTGNKENSYAFRLSHAAEDRLFFADERFRRRPVSVAEETTWTALDVGHKEMNLIDAAERGNATARLIHDLLKRCPVYHFSNTSETARIRQSWSVVDNISLKEDGANLAPFLLRLKEEQERYYTRIVETLREVIPSFGEFSLVPSNSSLLLRWTEPGTDLVFGPHQASDGTLRIMALVTLLLQPPESLPAVIILDEPELGMHPKALNVVAGLLRGISTKVQVIVATQSTRFVDCFDPQDVVVVERKGRTTTFERLDPDALETWLEEYTLSEIWEKNVIGGRP